MNTSLPREGGILEYGDSQPFCIDESESWIRRDVYMNMSLD